ncbi:MAG: phosphoheptose isomerase, partial [Bacteroidetes bacterium RBG_13_46_8]
MEEIRKNLFQAREILEAFLKDEKNMIHIREAGDVMVKALQDGMKIISCGNGGSMCDAMHFAEELTGRFRDDRPPVAAVAISDLAHITCTANDYSFERIFSRYIEALGKPGDVLLAISTSGNSVNIVRAAETARQKGLKVIGLTGKDGGKLSGLCDVEIRAPLSEYSDRAQEI